MAMNAPEITVDLLQNFHKRENFDCGNVQLNDYIRFYAKQDIQKYLTFVYVLSDSMCEVIGYYTLSSSSVNIAEVPCAIARNIKYRDVPVVLLGRFAVDKHFQGNGFGEKLLLSAMRKSLESPVASMAIVVEAKDEIAKSFYKKYGFTECFSS